MTGAITQARPSRPRYGPSVPTLVVGLRPGGRNRNRFFAMRVGSISSRARSHEGSDPSASPGVSRQRRRAHPEIASNRVSANGTSASDQLCVLLSTAGGVVVSAGGVEVSAGGVVVSAGGGVVSAGGVVVSAGGVVVSAGGVVVSAGGVVVSTGGGGVAAGGGVVAAGGGVVVSAGGVVVSTGGVVVSAGGVVVSAGGGVVVSA